MLTFLFLACAQSVTVADLAPVTDPRDVSVQDTAEDTAVEDTSADTADSAELVDTAIEDTADTALDTAEDAVFVFESSPFGNLPGLTVEFDGFSVIATVTVTDHDGGTVQAVGLDAFPSVKAADGFDPAHPEDGFTLSFLVTDVVYMSGENGSGCPDSADCVREEWRESITGTATYDGEFVTTYEIVAE